MNKRDKTYRESIDSLRNIVNRLSHAGEMDVDDLVRDVQEARQLIRYCEGKINQAGVTIREILTDLEATPKSSSPASPTKEGRKSRVRNMEENGEIAF